MKRYRVSYSITDNDCVFVDAENQDDAESDAISEIQENIALMLAIDSVVEVCANCDEELCDCEESE